MLVVGLGWVNPGTVLWEVLVAVHGVVGHHLGCGWCYVVAPRDGVLQGRGRLSVADMSILDRRMLRGGWKRAGGRGVVAQDRGRLARDGIGWITSESMDKGLFKRARGWKTMR